VARPSVAVVIPAYNRAATLRRCLESVVGQTLEPSEVIVVDDGSEDGTAGIAREYARRGVRCIRVQENAGAQAARNRGITGATAEWIAFLDSDDEWLVDKLQRQMMALETVAFDPWTVVHSAAITIDESNGRQRLMTVPPMEGANPRRQLLTQTGPLLQSMLVSKQALEAIGLLDESVPSYQEWDTAIRLAERCRFLYISEPTFVYRRNHGSETISSDAVRDIEGYQYVLDKFESDILSECGREVWEEHVSCQLRRSLDGGLWSYADRYFEILPKRDFRIRVLQLCRLAHIRPSRLSRVRNVAKRVGSVRLTRQGEST